MSRRTCRRRRRPAIRSFRPASCSYWQVIAADDANVTLHLGVGQAAARAPDGSDDPHEQGRALSRTGLSSPDDFMVQGDKPILVTQGMDCEPTLASAIPVDAPSDVQVFTLAPNFDHMLAIVRKNDGSGAGDARRSATSPASSRRSGRGSRSRAFAVPPCYGTVDQCVHTLTGAFGMSLRGMDVSSSYSTTFPSWEECASDSCTVP